LNTPNKPFSQFAPVIVFLFALLAMAPPAAWAHAVLVSSNPVENASVAGPDLTITLKYNSRVDAARSTVSLLAPDGKVLRLAIASQSAPELLSAKATGLAKGAYVLRWQVLASDGHITRGEIPFQIH
jgi:copper resistance protein C